MTLSYSCCCYSLSPKTCLKMSTHDSLLTHHFRPLLFITPVLTCPNCRFGLSPQKRISSRVFGFPCPDSSPVWLSSSRLRSEVLLPSLRWYSDCTIERFWWVFSFAFCAWLDCQLPLTGEAWYSVVENGARAYFELTCPNDLTHSACWESGWMLESRLLFSWHLEEKDYSVELRGTCQVTS